MLPRFDGFASGTRGPDVNGCELLGLHDIDQAFPDQLHDREERHDHTDSSLPQIEEAHERDEILRRFVHTSQHFAHSLAYGHWLQPPGVPLEHHGAMQHTRERHQYFAELDLRLDVLFHGLGRIGVHDEHVTFEPW